MQEGRGAVAASLGRAPCGHTRASGRCQKGGSALVAVSDISGDNTTPSAPSVAFARSSLLAPALLCAGPALLCAGPSSAFCSSSRPPQRCLGGLLSRAAARSDCGARRTRSPPLQPPPTRAPSYRALSTLSIRRLWLLREMSTLASARSLARCAPEGTSGPYDARPPPPSPSLSRGRRSLVVYSSSPSSSSDSSSAVSSHSNHSVVCVSSLILPGIASRASSSSSRHAWNVSSSTTSAA